MLLRRECLDSIGGFDERFGSYTEDVDICLRAKDSGWKVGVVAEAVAWGLGSVSRSAGPTMVANRVLLVARRDGRMAGILRAAASLGPLGARAITALGGSLAFWTDPEGRSDSKTSLRAHTAALRRILAILGARRNGRSIERQASQKPYEESVVERPRAHGGHSDGDSTRPRRGPVATIVITRHDRSESSMRALGSALGQTIRDIEVIVVDDGSAELLEAPGDDRIRVIRLDHPLGVCAARNRGIAAAQGQWITCLDEDGELVPNMLETSLRAAEDSKLSPPVAVLSGMEVLDPTGRIVEVRVPATVSRGTHLVLGDGTGELRPTNTLVAPAEVLRSIGGWDEAIGDWADDDLFLRLGTACSIQGIHRLTYRMRSTDSSGVLTDHLRRAESIGRTVNKHWPVVRAHPRARARFLAEMGRSYLKAGRWLPALAACTRSLVSDPRRPGAFRQWVGTLVGPRAKSWYVRRRRAPGRADVNSSTF